jgi:CBS domain-containing protein
MTAAVAVVSPEATLLDVAALMAREGLCHLVVVDGEGRVVGLVGEPEVERASGGQVGEVMVFPAFIAREDTSLVELAMELACRQLDLIPVVDAAARLVGVVWPTDLEDRLATLT